MNMANVGQKAPYVELNCVDSQGNEFSINSDKFQADWTALLFYPRDFSFVCPTEMIAISSRIEEFQESGCEVIGISIDDIATHKEWLNTPPSEGGVGKLRFPLAADEDGKVSKLFGVWHDENEMSQRALYLIDRDGVIQYSVVHGPNVGRNVDEILRVVDALNSGGVCPASWTTADGTLNIETMLKPGRTLGHYRIERELGTGAFGSVVQAQDLRLNRSVALKILKDNRGSVAKEKLLQEARSAARVRHEHVCTIFSVDEIDGLAVIVMDYLEGDTLQQRRDDYSEQGHKLSLMQRLATGLAAAHEVDVVHGDLKPGNVIIVNEQPVIVDFGLAFSAHESVESPATSSSESDDFEEQDFEFSTSFVVGLPEDVQQEGPLDATFAVENHVATNTDATVNWQHRDEETASIQQRPMVSGTPSYLPPEVLLDKRKDKKSDVFSLGIIFLEMVSGRRDLLGSNMPEIVKTLKRDDLDEFLCRDIDSPVKDVIRGMLMKNADARASANDVVQQLQQF